MIRKLWAMVYKDVYETYTDSSLLLIMLVTPLALASIISLAFGSLVSGDSAPLRDIPVAIVNQDVGEQGAIFANLLVPNDGEEAPSMNQQALDCGFDTATEESTSNTFLTDLTNAVLLKTPEEARQGVEKGDYAVAIIIPADFTEKMTFAPDNMNIQVSPVEVYGDSNRTISTSVMHSVAESIINQMLVGQIAVSSTIQTMIGEGMGLQATQIDSCLFAGAFNPDNTTVQLIQESARETDGNASNSINLLVMFGAAQAVFFALFTASGSATYILEERYNGTWQRLNATPTPRLLILLSKYLSTVANVLLQLVFLIVGFMVIDSLLKGEFSAVWGTQWGLLALLIVLLAFSVSGIGIIVSAFSKTAEQSNMIGQVIALFMGAVGGAFFVMSDGMLPILDVLSRFSLVYWGRNALITLSQGGTDIGLNLLMMAGLGVLFFAIGAFVFSRREDI